MEDRAHFHEAATISSAMVMEMKLHYRALPCDDDSCVPSHQKHADHDIFLEREADHGGEAR